MFLILLFVVWFVAVGSLLLFTCLFGCLVVVVLLLLIDVFVILIVLRCVCFVFF